MTSRNTFQLLWKMVNELDKGRREAKDPTGTILSRYAGIIDDRINNSGYSRNTDTLKLWTTKQLKDELERRKGEVSDE